MCFSPADKCQSRGGDEEYEKTVGYRVRASGPRGLVPYVLHRSRSPGITDVCVHECKNSPDCVAFFIDYKVGECYGIDDKATIRLEKDDNAAFFEGVCLRGISLMDLLKICIHMLTLGRFAIRTVKTI
jgi:hypothetical protein